MQVRVDYDIDNNYLANIIGSAQVGYWADVYQWSRKDLYLEFCDDETGLSYTCGALDFQNGLIVIAEKYPDHFRDIMDNDWDSTTGDVLIQCTAFGEIMYT